MNELTGISCISGLTLSLYGFGYYIDESDGSVNVCVMGLGGTGSSSATATIWDGIFKFYALSQKLSTDN